MNKLITSLTENQKLVHDEYRTKWFKIGTSIERADKLRAEKAIDMMYKVNGNKSPRFLWVESPLEAARKYKIKEMPWFIGQQDSYWIAFYLFCRDVLGVKYEKKYSDILDLHSEVAQSCCWWWPFEKAVVISDRPIECHMENGMLHKEGGMAVRFSDGFGSWNLHGVQVSKEIAETPAMELDAEIILTEKNAEIRREIVRKIGIERVILKLGARSLDKQGDYELLAFELGDGRLRPYLKMKNPSIGIWHLEGVPATIKTVTEALAWRNERQDAPEILT